MEAGAALFRCLWESGIPRIAIENPVMHGHAKRLIGTGAPTQTIQPYEFGHPESKRTCLWLKGLPKLQPTCILERPVCGYWENQTLSGQNRLGPSADRWKIRSETYLGIARAFAEQWGGDVRALRKAA